MARSRTPVFLRNAEAQDKYLERYNPWTGLMMSRLRLFFDEGMEGQYANLMRLIHRAEMKDETIRACKLRLMDEIEALPWSVKAVDELPAGSTEAQADAQREFLKSKYDQIENLKAAFAHLASAELRCFAHLEKWYDDAGNVIRLEPVPQWHWQRDGQYGEWKYSAKSRPRDSMAKAIEESERQHWIIREVETPWYEIGLTAALRINLARRDVDGFCSSYGVPSTFFIAPPGASADKLTEFAAIADDLVADGRGALPHGSDVKSVGQEGGEGVIFKQVIDDNKQAIVLAATGGLLTMLTAPGSGTLAGSAHQEGWEKLVSGVAKKISEVFQSSFDKAELALKFPGQPVLAYMELAYPDADESRSDFVDDVVKLNTAGWKVKREILEEKTSLQFEDAAENPAPGLPVPPSPSLRNRFMGGPSSARDRAEAMQLVEGSIAAALDVAPGILAAVQPELAALIELASAKETTAADFRAMALKLEGLLPELIDETQIEALADEIEKALGAAAAMGAQAGIRKRGKSKKRGGQ
jgi:phage gp29-like protein